MLYCPFKKFVLVFFCLPILLCNAASKLDLDQNNLAKFLTGPFKGGWYTVKQDITSQDFLLVLKGGFNKLEVTAAYNLNDESFREGKNLINIQLNHMSKLTGKALSYLPKVTFLKLENCPGITYKDLLKMRSLQKVYLWNMPHFTNKQLAIIRERKIKVIDGRFKKYKNARPWDGKDTNK